MQAILYTKLKGKAMQDFETRDIQTFEELKYQLETCYQTRQSTTHLQIEFNLLKVDLLAMKLYDSMIEGEKHPAHSKRTIHETIKKQALINFQIGLRDEFKVLVRTQRYTTLQEAITGASAEDKLLGPTKSNYLYNKNKFESSESRQNRSSTPQCFKCKKTAITDATRPPRINTINKYCKYCKKSGHNREECWSLNGRPRKHEDKVKENNKKPNEKFAESKRSPRQFKRNSESDTEYRVTHIKEAPRNRAKNELLLVTIPMRQVKNEEIQMLHDSGSTISLIKLKHLKDDTPIQEEKIALTGNKQPKVKHTFYVVRDDIPIEYEGIIGYLLPSSTFRNLKRHAEPPFNKIILKPRSEMIIKARTDQNRIGIVRAEEKAPGVYIGNCIVNAADYTYPVSIINTTDREALLRICKNFCDIFHVDGESLTCTATVEHEINTRTDISPMNMRPYRLPEKHKTEVNKQVLKDRIIWTSTSQWNAPLLVVPKKADASGKSKLRAVIDFRKLNDLTIGDSFPLPNITDILDQLGNAKYFTTLDLASGYHQIPMTEKNKNKTAFSTPYRHYEFNRMPFGLKNAPATF
ncbi:hypothetical protein ACFW04_010527 [Cataglyphis niger]